MWSFLPLPMFHSTSLSRICFVTEWIVFSWYQTKKLCQFPFLWDIQAQLVMGFLIMTATQQFHGHVKNWKPSVHEIECFLDCWVGWVFSFRAAVTLLIIPGYKGFSKHPSWFHQKYNWVGLCIKKMGFYTYIPHIWPFNDLSFIS